MAQAGGRLFDNLGRLMNDAVGAADSVKREIDTVVRSQAERILGDLDLVRREEFEAVRELAANARAESEKLAARVAALESELAFSNKTPGDSQSSASAAKDSDPSATI
ncbi:accessory factor UbiK family protein [Terrihabitans sp. B22-R8]|uniref:accessory factor UbiK family protein n=1 Tax=Terrihabitans sp. B22-R8 TaxID=3425128 RepID=UPI00403C0181